MIYTNELFNSSFEVKENEIPVLIIENRSFYQRIINGFNRTMFVEEVEQKIYINNKEIDFDKSIVFISDVFNVRLNETKIISKLYSKIKEDFVYDEKYLETAEITAQMLMYINDIVSECDFSLEFNEELDPTILFKSIGLRFSEESNLVNRLCDYIRVCKYFLKVSVIVICNLRQILTCEELNLFYQFAHYEKVNIFLLETTNENTIEIESEKIRLIDYDLCVIG